MAENERKDQGEEFIFSDSLGAFDGAPSDSRVSDEFEIPDTLDLSADFGEDAPSSPATDYAKTLWKPYVPKFTEVTENRYYFADTSAVPAATVAEDSGKTPAPPKKSPANPTISVERIDGRIKPSEDKKDPTAEVKSTVPEAVVVNIKGKKPISDSTINVFKFSDGKEKKEVDAPSDEEKQRREIASLTGHDFREKQPEPVPVPSEPIQDEDIKPTVSYTPEEDKLSIREREFKEQDREYDYKPDGEEKASKNYATDTSDYNSFAMKDSFKDVFLDSLTALKIRLIVGIVLGAASLLMSLFHGKICSWLGFTDALNAPVLIDAALIVSFMIIALPEITVGIKSLIAGVVAPELSNFVIGLAMLGISLYFGLATDVKFFISPVYAVTTLISMFANYCLQKSRFTAFRTVSAKGIKYILDCKNTRTLEAHNMALDGIVNEHKSKCAKVFSTTFVSGFFKNCSTRREDGRSNAIMLGIIFGVGSALGVVVYFLFDLAAALSSCALTLALAGASAATLSHKLPLLSLEKKLGKNGCSIVGEAAVYNLAASDVLIFDDTEVFGPDDVTLKSASDKRSNYYDSMRKMAALYGAVGGPLATVFESALNNAKPTPATNVKVGDDGISGTVDGKLIEAGTREYMLDRNIAVPYVSLMSVGGTKVIYAAEDGEFFGTFTVNYSFSEEFARMLSAMKESGIVPLVYTRDFNITNEFMRGLTHANDIIRVMRKYDTAGQVQPFARVRCPVVCSADKEITLSLMQDAKRYVSVISLLSTLELAEVVVGALGAVVLAVLGKSLLLPCAVFALWQAVWGIAFAIIGTRSFKTNEKETDDAEQ